MPNFFLFLAAAAAVVCAPAFVLLAQTPPEAGEIALVVGAPWGPAAADVAARAGVQEIAPDRAPLGVLVQLDNPQSTDRLYRQGAWLVLNGRKVLELCAN